MQALQQVEQVIKKLEHLSPERVHEVEDFIDFLNQKDQDQLVKAAQMTAEPSFQEVWDNQEDSIYDRL